ncbi:MAG: spermidine/putrescine ABC transporter substrate-binding protein, partial [Oscillospiraceae bacterium]
MKKIVCAFLALLVMASCVVMPCFAAVKVDEGYDYTRFKDDKIVLNVYNWGQYISDGSDGSLSVEKEFEDLTGIEVNYTTYDTNESLYSKMKSGGADYDVVIPSDYMIGKMVKEGMLEKLDTKNIPNISKIGKEYMGL